MQPNVPVIPPAQTIFVLTVVGLVVLAFVCMLILKVSIVLAERRAGVAYRWEAPPPREKGTMRQWIESWAAETEARYTPRRYLTMSSDEEGEEDVVSDLVCIPVSNIGMDRSGMDAVTPDIDAGNAGMPRLSRNITEEDELAFLCVVRNPDGKYRHSANKIYELIGGDRNTVLAKIKEIRAVPPAPEFRQPDGSTAPAQHPITA